MATGIMVSEGRHGRGVFATRRFDVGELVETCPTVQVPDRDLTGTLRDYAFTADNERDVVLALGYGMLYNHSAEPNLEYAQDAGGITFYALRAVQPGEELTIDYGEEWWEMRERVPD